MAAADGISRAAGVPVTLRVPKGWPGALTGGFDEVVLPGMKLEHFALVERHLLKDRPDPFAVHEERISRLLGSKRAGDRKMGKALLDRAAGNLEKSKAQNKLKVEEVQDWLDSAEGAYWTFSLLLREGNPGISDADIRRVWDWAGQDEVKRLRDVASGTDRLGNSTGSPAPGDAAPEGPPPGPTGAASTDSSPASTAGPPGS